MAFDRPGHDGPSSSTRWSCEHDCEHVLTVRPGDTAGGSERWQGSLTALSKVATDVIVFEGASRQEVLLEGRRRLNDGGCACPEGAFHRAMLAKAAIHQAEVLKLFQPDEE